VKTFSELDHMRVYRQTLMVPFNEKNKKKGTVVHLVGTESMQAEVIIQDPIIKNPNLIEGYYFDKSIAHLINDNTEEEQIKEEYVEEAGVGAGMAAGYIGKLALDVALKYSKKYIDAREAKTPTQKATAAKVFMTEYKRGKKSFERFKNRDGNRALKGTTPDAWWISWFGIDSKDIRAIGTNERNKVKNTKFYNMLKDARGNTKIAANYVDEFDKFLEKKDFYLISSGVEDNGKIVPFKVEYFYCPQVDKIFNCSVLNGIINIDYKHPISISDYLNRSKVSMLEIKDVLKICKENEKEDK